MTIEEDVAELQAFITTHDNIPPVDAALDRLTKERDELREALREIAALTWNPAIGLPAPSLGDLHLIARRAIEPEVVA